MNQDLKIVKTVFMRGQKEGKKCMVKNKENEEKEKIREQEEGKKKKYKKGQCC